MEGEVLPTESNQIPGVTSSGQYEWNYLTVFALMPHIDDMHSEDLVQYGLVSLRMIRSCIRWPVRPFVHPSNGIVIIVQSIFSQILTIDTP